LRNRTGKILLAMSATMVLVAAGWYRLSGICPATPDRSLMAFLQCSDLVATRLHTVAFDAAPSYRAQRARNNTYAIRASIDADPDPVVERRIDYVCRIKWLGRDEILSSGWKLLELQMDGSMAPSAPPVAQPGDA
jgi:hypothetical protein